MSGPARRLSVLLTLASVSAGCSSIDFAPWGGPAYTLHTDQIGSGRTAITPRNDAQYSNGEPSITGQGIEDDRLFLQPKTELGSDSKHPSQAASLLLAVAR
jgi:hypothetical protein